MERVVIGKTGLEVYRLGFGGIPIQIILGLRSIARRMGEGFLLKAGPREAIERARHCSECGECMGRCPYQLPIPDLIRENLQWWDEQRTSA